MNRQEFLNLVALQGKRIDDDLAFEDLAGKAPIRSLKPVEVFNTGGIKIRLNGHYHPLYRSITFNFVCPEAGGPICRVDVRGQVHKQAGRTHKHDVHRPSDPVNNLPEAHARPDLAEFTPEQVWRDLCTRANINHTGRFADPHVQRLPIPSP